MCHHSAEVEALPTWKEDTDVKDGRGEEPEEREEQRAHGHLRHADEEVDVRWRWA